MKLSTMSAPIDTFSVKILAKTKALPTKAIIEMKVPSPNIILEKEASPEKNSLPAVTELRYRRTRDTAIPITIDFTITIFKIKAPDKANRRTNLNRLFTGFVNSAWPSNAHE